MELSIPMTIPSMVLLVQIGPKVLMTEDPSQVMDLSLEDLCLGLARNNQLFLALQPKQSTKPITMQPLKL